MSRFPAYAGRKSAAPLDLEEDPDRRPPVEIDGSSNCGGPTEPVSGHVGLHLRRRRRHGSRSIASRRLRRDGAEHGVAHQDRGSAGFRMMIAFPLSAPPISRSRAVVRVNSSMLALVPGPADSDAIDATISA